MLLLPQQGPERDPPLPRLRRTRRPTPPRPLPGLRLRLRLRHLLAGTDGQIRPELDPVYATLKASAPQRVLLWLRHRAPAGVLTDLAGRSGRVTHEVLDQLRPVRSVQHLRAALVAGRVLPPRDENLAQLPGWIDKTTARLADPAERRVVRAFATWHHLHRLRRQPTPVTDEQVHAMRADIKTAVHLLVWLRNHGTALATCRQSDIDEWAADQTWRHDHARTFLTWAVRNRHAARVRLQARPRQLVAVSIEADHRWTLVHRLLHDDALDPVDRLAGLLVLLLAQPLARIARLTVNQIVDDGGHLALQLGTKPVRLPPPVDHLVIQLRERRHGYAVVGRVTDNRWLFPGGRPGRPLTSSQLLRRMTALGIQARPARNSTLMDLAAQLPAVVLARLLGVAVPTATRWTGVAGAPQAEYAANLARRTNERGRDGRGNARTPSLTSR